MSMSKNALINTDQGVSQTQRWLDTLIPEYIQIDSKDKTDLISFIHKISPQFNYYNAQTNEVDGTWEDFLFNDPYLLTLLISRTNVSLKIDQFEKIIKSISNEHFFLKQLQGLTILITFLFNLESELSKLQDQLRSTNLPNQLEELVASMRFVEKELFELRMICEECSMLFEDFENPNVYPSLSEQEKKDFSLQNIFTGESDQEKILNTIPYFVELFNRIFENYNHLVVTSKLYFTKNSLLDKQFSPQIGLLLGFLDLYKYAQLKINLINRQHLNYYYKELLQLKQKQGNSDLVHLIIEPELQTKRLKINPSDLLIAEISGQEEAFIYELNTTTNLSFAEIAEIKTIFVSRYKIPSKNSINDLVERQIFHASQKLFIASEFIKNTDNFPSWPALGEDQHGQIGSMRTMDDSNIGLNIASPLFYLTEGKRHITIIFFLKPESFHDLELYFANYAKFDDKEDKIAKYELLSTAFIISYTSIEGWQEISSYEVKFGNDDNNDKTLEIKLTLDTTEPAIDNYNKEIHQCLFDSEFPIIRVGLNNFSNHHPYSFFEKSEIQRMIIKSRVEDFRSLILQNNIGLVSTTTPFQIFGSQPMLGSFLDIKNSNVFNRYLKDVSLKIDWLNLPDDNGGFEAYYKEYDEPFKNESFEVFIKTLKNGGQYHNLQEQQRKSLFRLKKGGGFLDHYTIINQIDFSKLEFLNELTLSNIGNEDNFSNKGVLRIELCSPAETFGQKSFPQIFPKAVMLQAKKKGAKQILPRQPIIPIVKSISIDYSLEHSEAFNGSNTEDCKIKLIHDYPFGYDIIYPNKYKQQIKMMPQFSDYDNLCIGLKKVDTNSELNLLIKFEDYCFQYTLHEVELITWSYLENNNWVCFEKKDILFDTTNNFITTGVIRLFTPLNMPIGNTIMNPDLFWIKATTKDKNGFKPRIIGITVNGCIATRQSLIASSSETTVSIQPNQIKGFLKTVKGVGAVYQPFPSINGKSPESTDKFYVRISERLRHKQRPVQIKDIVQIVLEEFPQIMMVKCFNTEVENYLLISGTNLHLVLIPKELNAGDFLQENPQVSLSTLFEVKSFLQKYISPFIKIEVGNPIYEKVKIICKVVLDKKATEDSGYYLRELITEINNYIAPWINGKYDDFKIGNRIYKSDLLMFIKTRSYISYVTGFSVIHFYNYQDISRGIVVSELVDTAINDLEYIVSSSPASVLIPSQNHVITMIDTPVNEQVTKSGIGNFIIGEELIIKDDNNNKEQNIRSLFDDSDEDELFNLIITR